MSQICIFGVIALSLTVLTGWSGQVSLGQFGFVAVGADIAAHFGSSLPIVLLLPAAGAATAVVSVLVGLTALRIRGLYLAVSTLGFALFMQTSVLATPCFTLPLIHRTICSGLPNPESTLIARPSLFGLNLSSEQAFAWFSLGVLVLSALMVRVWRDRGVARRLIAVRDNEIAAGTAGIPVVRTKLLAFALSGFMAGYAGVCLAFATERFSTATFDPTFSILVVSMVVIGGLDSIPGAILGALYLEGLPAIFGSTPTVQFLTSGARAARLHPLSPGRHGAAAAPIRRSRHRRGGEPARPAWRCPAGRSVRSVRSVGCAVGGSACPPRGAAQPGRRRGALDRRSVTDAMPTTAPPDRPADPDAAPDRARPTRHQGARRSLRRVARRRRREPHHRGRFDRRSHRGQRVGQDDTARRRVRPRPSSSGRLILDDADLADYIPEERARLGIVRSFQDCRLYPELTVEDTLLLCEDARHRVGVLSTTLQMPWARRAEGQKRKAIDGVIASFGLERFRLHSTAHLSTGTRRVVDLASIVLANPRLLLLDEPTAGIAQREAEAFIPLLRRLHEVTDSTILLVEHDVPLVFELCSKVVVMQTGEVVAAGTPDEVRRDPRALAAYLGASDEAINVSGPLAASSVQAVPVTAPSDDTAAIPPLSEDGG